MENLPCYQVTEGESWQTWSEIHENFDISRIQGGACAWIEERLHNLETFPHHLPQQLTISDLQVNQARSLSPEELERWQKNLNLPSIDLVKKTLKASTQLAIVDYNPTLTRIRPHLKRRFWQLGSNRLSETVYTDPLVIPEENVCKESHNYRYVQVFYGGKSKYIFLYPMKCNIFILAFHGLQ